MQLISQTSTTTIENTYEVLTPYGVAILKEFENAKGKVIDSCFRWKNTGKEIDDPALLEEVQSFVDSLPKVR